jgi:3-dehydroquinate synthase
MTAMRTLTVELADCSYPIHIGPALLAQADLLQSAAGAGRALIVTNETVAPLYLARVRQALGETRAETLVLPDGEAHKTLETVGRIYDALLESGFGRDATLLALGGGVVGDITGFAAATYQRGIGFVQLPTTLLAQVDSSVGGKTGVNHPLGKNMIGAFHQPRAVIADTGTLRTLPDRELKAGLAEVIKYGVLGNEAFFAWLEKNIDALAGRDDTALAEAIQQSCRDKAHIVALDERESGPRALLNLGHTFGHAIETALGYGVWLHGESVAAGLCMAADLSCRATLLKPAERDRIIALVARAGLPVRLPGSLKAADLHRHMLHDKKVLAGRLRLVLLKSIGEAIVTADFDPALLDETLAAYCAPPFAS